MGIHTDVKKYIMNHYPAAFNVFWDPSYSASGGNGSGPSTPLPHATAFMFDQTNRLKYLSHDITTGREFFSGQILPDVLDAYKSGAVSIYICYDRKPPELKSMEHKKRYKKTVMMPIPTHTEPLVTETRLPSREEWDGFVNNKWLVADLLSYITHMLLDDQTDDIEDKSEQNKTAIDEAMKRTFYPNVGTTVYLHGGTPMDRQESTYTHGRPDLPPLLYFVETRVHQILGHGGMTHETHERKVGYVDNPSIVNEDQVRRLLEGEMACLYYASLHDSEDCCIVTVDGDLLLLMLMAAQHRIDPKTNLFRNKHWLVLRMNGTDDVVVDINQLYSDIAGDQVFAAGGVREPVITFCALAFLSKDDYVHDYTPGIKLRRNPETDENVPYPLYIMATQPALVANLFTIKSMQCDSRTPVDLRIDEEAFIRFTRALYVDKFKDSKALLKKYTLKNASDVTHAHVRGFLSTRKRPENRMMSTPIMRRFSRQLLWRGHYGINGGRGQCIVESPFATCFGQPYYGWIKSSTGCQSSNCVSRKRKRSVLEEEDDANTATLLYDAMNDEMKEDLAADITAEVEVPRTHPSTPQWSPLMDQYLKRHKRIGPPRKKQRLITPSTKTVVRPNRRPLLLIERAALRPPQRVQMPLPPMLQRLVPTTITLPRSPVTALPMIPVPSPAHTPT